MVYLISYDLNRPGQTYSSVHNAIKGLGDWCHPLESTWLVDSYLTADQVSERVRSSIDSNDLLLVIGVTRDRAGFLPKEAWQWLESHRLAA